MKQQGLVEDLANNGKDNCWNGLRRWWITIVMVRSNGKDGFCKPHKWVSPCGLVDADTEQTSLCIYIVDGSRRNTSKRMLTRLVMLPSNPKQARITLCSRMASRIVIFKFQNLKLTASMRSSTQDPNTQNTHLLCIWIILLLYYLCIYFSTIFSFRD